jgi:hypothetical protein
MLHFRATLGDWRQRVLRWLVSPINVQAADVLAKPVTSHVDLSFEQGRSDRTGKSQGIPLLWQEMTPLRPLCHTDWA